MTIERQYSLPNCTLVLQGLGDPAVISSAESRPVLSNLFNAECYLTGLNQPLSGGREFLDSLVTTVSRYAQEILSGICRGERALHRDQGLVRLERIDTEHHRLIVQSPPAATGVSLAPQPTSQTVDLSNVQVFDLMEAVDQLLADAQTLPDLTLKPFDNLTPLSKRYVHSGEPLVKQAAPAALGASGLALATAALFALPVPKVNQPANLNAQPTATTSTTPGASPAASPPGAKSAPDSSPTAAPTPETVASGDLARLESVLTTAPEITDASQLGSLQKQLYDQVEQAWKNRSEIPQDLVYRLGVNKDGAIVGYKPVNPAALTYSNQTPLLNLLSLSAATSRADSDPIAQFKVVFTPSGSVDVAPWQQVMAAPIDGSSEITDAAQLKELQPKLYDEIDQNWKVKPSFNVDLIYRVRVKPDGTIADYRPESQAATDYVQELPLSQMSKPAADSDEPTSEPLALFKVVFKPDGKLEVSSWRGIRETNSNRKTP
ncbi:MAG: DUF4335 domain-containing protein [Leptolyngbyaceae cyanobacterium]